MMMVVLIESLWNNISKSELAIIHFDHVINVSLKTCILLFIELECWPLAPNYSVILASSHDNISCIL
ncbi:hypothetical protein BpHYR1_018695 [Brachionus plicatilis]|uniref:Uncharacterized protein n=1 Tax=Brachionus plicatilis TaxID=10195 RepID=A0A3M7S5D8_BRAPC|nr:hypothetical protein BpHYR1_018695 [Brachionus plicatilis]